MAAIPGTAYAVVGVAFALLVATLGLFYANGKRERVEDPVRIKDFIEKLKALEWGPQTAGTSLDTLFDAATSLIEAEVRYYYRSRISRRRVATATRFGAFVFGTTGLLCPLLAAAMPAWAGLTRLGYLFFAAAAACFTANELFGGTRGHVRAVTTQYHLESLLSAFVLDWNAWRASRSAAPVSNPVPLEGAFDLVRAFLRAVYALMEAETGEWSSAVAQAETSFKAQITPQRSSGSDADAPVVGTVEEKAPRSPLQTSEEPR